MVCIYFKDQSLFSENNSFFHIILKLRYYIKYIHFFVLFSVAYISNKQMSNDYMHKIFPWKRKHNSFR